MESIAEAFARHLKDAPDREALWSRGEGVRSSFGQLDEAALAWQRLLAVGDQRPIGVAVGNVAAFCHISLAMLRLGIPMVALDGSTSFERQMDLCRHLGVTHLLHRGTEGESLIDGVRRSPIDPSPEDQSSYREVPTGTALIKLTSGSTGRPVGICLRAEALAHGIHQIGDAMELDSTERVLIAIPLSHSYGFDNGVLSLFALGTPLILEPGIFPTSLLKALAESQATFMPLVPPLVRSLGQTDWPTDLALRRVICAGGVLHAGQAEEFYRRSGRAVQNFYGSTETGGISFESAPLDASAFGTVGHPLPGVTVELDTEGRVTVQSPGNFSGYFGGCSQADEGSSDIEGGRTVVCGDTGEWTAEGRLRLTGRTADILNIGGRKVSAVRVEEILRQLEGVTDVAVVGVDDAVRGDRTVAFLVTDVWPIDNSSVPATLLPREMRQLQALPYNERGKLERHRLRQLATQKPRSTDG